MVEGTGRVPLPDGLLIVELLAASNKNVANLIKALPGIEPGFWEID